MRIGWLNHLLSLLADKFALRSVRASYASSTYQAVLEYDRHSETEK